MKHSQEYEVHVLNELIVATLECAQKWRNAAFTAGQRGATLLLRCAVQHMQAVEQLAAQVRMFDAKPAGPDSMVATTSLLARRRRQHAGVDVSEPQSPDDSSALLREYFETAIEDIRISDLVRSVIRTAFDRIGDSWPSKTHPLP